jgi:hypothetical protein
VFLEGLGAPELPDPLDGFGVAQQVGVDPLFNACLSGGPLRNLPDPLPVHVEEPVAPGQPMPEGVGLEPMGQGLGN